MRRILYPTWMDSMPECDNCALCCGPVGITQDEYGAVKDYCQATGIDWTDRGGFVCGFLNENNRCRIYEVRPFICRIYGIVAEAPCLRYPRAARLSFPPEEARRQGFASYGAVLLESTAEQVSSAS